MTRKNTIAVAVAALVGFAAACATGAGLRPLVAQAPVPGQFRECIATTVWVVQGRTLNTGQIPQPVIVPPGWTPVGGGASDSNAFMILCH
jgi:hypothetical protein